MTENRKVAVIVLAAGKGTRMKSDLPKVMMPLCGKPMIRHIIETLEAMNVDKIVPVVSADGAMIAKEVAPYETALQEKQLGMPQSAPGKSSAVLKATLSSCSATTRSLPKKPSKKL